MKCCLATIGALSALLWTARSAAAAEASHSIALRWQAPEGCPTQPQVDEEIRSALAQLQGHGEVEVSAVVSRREADAAGFSLRVRVAHEGQTGERVLPLEDCQDASRAAALLVALSVSNPPPLPAPPPPPPARPELRWTLGAGPRLALGIAPEVSAGFGLSASYSRSFWRLSARGGAFAPSHHAIPGRPLGGSFQLFTGGVFACAGYPGAVTFYGCFGGRVDRLRGRGTGGSASFQQSTNIASLAAGVTLEWSLTRRFRLRTEVEAGYPLADARFTIRNETTPVHEVDALRGEAALELAVAF
ncbi:MAG: hypothetical protein EOO73_01080 [Myxococcales bacterium]|nr:MAG: hypothetical protein EOO73_01080 [Myxococcales bacterium]